MTKIAGSGHESRSGSISQRHESADPDSDSHQNVMDPQNWKNDVPFSWPWWRTCRPLCRHSWSPPRWSWDTAGPAARTGYPAPTERTLFKFVVNGQHPLLTMNSRYGQPFNPFSTHCTERALEILLLEAGLRMNILYLCTLYSPDHISQSLVTLIWVKYT